MLRKKTLKITKKILSKERVNVLYKTSQRSIPKWACPSTARNRESQQKFFDTAAAQMSYFTGSETGHTFLERRSSTIGVAETEAL